MKLGLIGLSNSGKTTIFNALARAEAEVTPYANTNIDPNLAVVDVGDERVTKLSEMYQPKKTIYATIEIVDFVGFGEGAARNGAFDGSMMQTIKTMDAIALVVRNFHDDLMGDATPLADIEQIDVELIMSDLIIAENRMERIQYSFKRGMKTNELQIEEKAISKIIDQLNDNKAIRDIDFTKDEEKAIRGFQFLTQRPFIVILNSDESGFGKNQSLLSDIEKSYNVIEFAGNFEMELSRMDEDEAMMFMEDIGITNSARNRLTQFIYKMLGYISFFTVGSDEVRAWNIISGDNAVTAAGKIHTDLARGFIRAECFTYDDLLKFGSEAEVKKNGKFRLEGKEYIVNDGDILSIRFNV
ncbi:redox-regulated ATPase YchF [candidate division KSB1 bacterium]|nr:redox-regulated ATPase YchF [candidate division KSB1 bacterium]